MASPDMLDTPLPESWAELVRLAIALITGTVGKTLLDAWIKRAEARSNKEEKEHAAEQAREDREEIERAEYEKNWRAELRAENREMREAFQQLEKKYRECEEDRGQVHSDLYMLRNKVQYLELRLAMQEPPPATGTDGDSALPPGQTMRLKKK